jgi:hypothetical protein
MGLAEATLTMFETTLPQTEITTGRTIREFFLQPGFHQLVLLCCITQ